MARPVRAPVKWRMEDGKAVLVYKKSLTKVERKLKKVIGGPENIRRPLDEPGTDIWLMCDGEHTLWDIIVELDSKYKEDIEPVDKRVSTFIEMLLKLNLVHLEEPDAINKEKGKSEKKGFEGKNQKKELKGKKNKDGGPKGKNCKVKK